MTVALVVCCDSWVAGVCCEALTCEGGDVRHAADVSCTRGGVLVVLEWDDGGGADDELSLDLLLDAL